eukprot:NODE_5823_length_673_cov_328.362179_g4926_i0.p3 GENE.NODE_5823_length_673_cov_328.362179_g4926_i0~~NODE_5823_length_673_cov_328.362179_g4926_i0.p3  ORF type:complete len:82 (-),score=52.84 NODE_5823_length_673_cov_328.362179_g4926_i0:321-566(-)
MPREIKKIDAFLKLCQHKGKVVKVKKNLNNTKFKVRTSRFLYTLVVKDPKKADKISASLPPTVEKVEIGRGNKAAKKDSKQ